MPWLTAYVSQTTTITQFSGCTSGGEVVLKPPKQQESDHLNGEHADERHAEASAHRRSQASRAPSAMSNPPVTRSSQAFTVGRVKTAPSRSMNQA